MEEMFSMLNSIPFVGMAIHLIKKYTFTIILSTILSLYLFYYHRNFRKHILLFYISVPILVILKIFVESTPERILLYSHHPVMRVATIYVVFGMTYFVISSNIENIVKKIKTSKLYGWFKK